jgi:hypothetical protein
LIGIQSSIHLMGFLGRLVRYRSDGHYIRTKVWSQHYHTQTFGVIAEFDEGDLFVNTVSTVSQV